MLIAGKEVNQLEITNIKLLSARRFSSLICSKHFTHEMLAGSVKCSVRQIQNWAKQDTDVHASYLFALAEVFQVDVEELLVSVPLPETRV